MSWYMLGLFFLGGGDVMNAVDAFFEILKILIWVFVIIVLEQG